MGQDRALRTQESCCLLCYKQFPTAVSYSGQTQPSMNPVLASAHRPPHIRPRPSSAPPTLFQASPHPSSAPHLPPQVSPSSSSAPGPHQPHSTVSAHCGRGHALGILHHNFTLSSQPFLTQLYTVQADSHNSHVPKCVYVHACMFVHVHVEARGQPWMSSLGGVSPYFFETRSLNKPWNLVISLGWLPTAPGSTCLQSGALGLQV